MSKWVAVLMSSEVAHSSFPSKEKAWEFVFTHGMCTSCSGDRQAWKDGVEWNPDAEQFPTEYPPCSSEWEVMTEDEYMTMMLGSGDSTTISLSPISSTVEEAVDPDTDSSLERESVINHT